MLYLIYFLSLAGSGGAYVILGYTEFFYAMIFVCLCVHLLTKSYIRYYNESFLIGLLAILLFLFAMFMRGEAVLYRDNLNIILKFFVVVLFSIAISSGQHENHFRIAKFIFEILTTIGLIVWILANIIPLFRYFFIEIYPYGLGNYYQSIFECDLSYKTLFGMYFYKTCDLYKFGFIRNHGIYWEPGVNGSFTIIFYILKRFYLQEKSGYYLYGINIFSTFSVGAILIMIFLVITPWILFRRKQYISYKKYVLIGSIALVLLGVTFVTAEQSLLEILSAIFGRDFQYDSSIRIRYYDFLYGIKAVWDDGFIWGLGSSFENYNYHLTIGAGLNKLAYGGGISNAIVSILYRYGLIFFSFYIYLIWNFSCKVSKSHQALIFITIILTLMHEPLDMSLLILLLLFCPPHEKINSV